MIVFDFASDAYAGVFTSGYSVSPAYFPEGDRAADNGATRWDRPPELHA